MFNKQVWLEFWNTLQKDFSDCLQDKVLNFATLVAVLMIYVHWKFPELKNEIDAFATAYLLNSKGDGK